MKQVSDVLLCVFGDLQLVDQLNVVKDLFLVGFLQLAEDVIFEVTKLSVALLDLLDDGALGLLELGLLLAHDDTEALLFETLLFDREVDHIDLGGDLGRVVRVADPRRDEKPELLVVDGLVVANLDLEVAAYLDEGLVEQVVQGWVKLLTNVL